MRLGQEQEFLLPASIGRQLGNSPRCHVGALYTSALLCLQVQPTQGWPLGDPSLDAAEPGPLLA